MPAARAVPGLLAAVPPVEAAVDCSAGFSAVARVAEVAVRSVAVWPAAEALRAMAAVCPVRSCRASSKVRPWRRRALPASARSAVGWAV
ncbi:hypothetical protein D3C86_1567290 [compost metagenome]